MRGGVAKSSKDTVFFVEVSVFSVAGTRPVYTEGRRRVTSARGRSASHSSSGFIMDSDEEEFKRGRSQVCVAPKGMVFRLFWS